MTKYDYYYYYYFKLRTAALRLIVRSWLEVPSFATRRGDAAAEGGTVGEKCPLNFA